MSSGWAPRASSLMPGSDGWRTSSRFPFRGVEELDDHRRRPGEPPTAAGCASDRIVVFGKARTGDELEAGANDAVGDFRLACEAQAIGDHVVHHQPHRPAPVALRLEARIRRIMRGDDETHAFRLACDGAGDGC